MSATTTSGAGRAAQSSTASPARERDDAGGPGDPDALEAHRRELTAHCYRMLGSFADAEDAVQEALTRAWRAADRFEGRASLRTWLYRIATNVCLDRLDGRARRVRPMDLGPASTVAEARLVTVEGRWLEPIADDRVIDEADDPAARAQVRDRLRLAFVAALQSLPPRQRAVLLLREVVALSAREVAELLDTSTASVNSALQRARASLAERDVERGEAADPLDDEQQALLARYLDAFERYDMAALSALLAEDATQTMPPFDLWLQGRDEVVAWMVGPGAECEGSRLVPVAACGQPAAAQYRRAADGDGHEAWALQVLEVEDGRVVGCNAFLDTAELFPRFGLPLRLPAGAPAPA